ncbi:hypothetical protein [Pelagicoccus sp. SDUM812005]|uniref:hypothetical protein n=1 Tax=Pelagicoccus sp. SDUM812005 TaxID=3041257 RepID=UPI00280DEF7B|nr:hypothetical protein [Pelagicoccus sp. SDUM812005]MDQ8183010.1 hypothetical protein [Pelagicoccus sp. SDUM812005]
MVNRSKLKTGLFALLAIASGYAIGVSIKPLPETDNKKDKVPEPSAPLAAPSTPKAPNTPAPHDESLSAAQCIERIRQWMESSDALPQQFPLYDAIAKTPPAAFREVALALSDSKSETIGEAREVLILRWRMDDPEGLLRFHHHFKESYPRSSYYSADVIIQKLVQSDLRHTLDLLAELEAKGENLAAEFRALYHIASKLPHSQANLEAIAFAEAGANRLGIEIVAKPPPHTQPEQPAPSVSNILTLLEKDTNSALHLFNKLVKSDPDTALELALSIENSDTKERFLGRVVSDYGEAHPHESIWLLRELYTVNDRNSISQIEILLSKALAADPSAATTWAKDPGSKELITRFLQTSHSARPEFLPLLSQLEDSHWKRDKIARALQSLGQRDYQASQDWIAANLTAEEAPIPQAGLIIQHFEHAPQKALALIDKLPPGPTRQIAIGQLSRHWGQRDLDAALDWAKKQSAPQDQANAFQSLAQLWVNDNPQAAQDFAQQNRDPQTAEIFDRAIYQHLQQFASSKTALLYFANSSQEFDRNRLARQAFANYAATDPLGAIELSLENPAFEGAAHLAANRWAQSDPDAATRYLLKLGGKVAEIGIPAIVHSYAEIEPQRLIELDQQITDPEMRKAFYHSVRSSQILKQYNPAIYQQIIDDPAP